MQYEVIHIDVESLIQRILEKENYKSLLDILAEFQNVNLCTKHQACYGRRII